MKSTIIKAPAKVNLYLDVINKRSDGYHNIETVFERISLCDWIKVSLAAHGIKLICNKNIPIGTNNTVYKAAKLLSTRYNLKYGFKIEIDKRIPIAAGLGGGSSDAAATLLGISKLLDIKLNKKDLLEIAAKIGADVPFFASKYNRAFATGIGEKLTPLKQGQKWHFLIVVPRIKISTASVYSKGGFALTKKKRGVNILRSYLQLDSNNIKNTLFNKLEDIVLPLYPELGRIKKALNKTGVEGVLVSGSGSAVYAIFQDRKGVVRAEETLSKEGNWQLFLAESY